MSMRPRLVEEGSSILTDKTGKKCDDDYQMAYQSHPASFDEQLHLASTKSGNNDQQTQQQKGRSKSSLVHSPSLTKRSSSLRKALQTSKQPCVHQFEINNRGQHIDKCILETSFPAITNIGPNMIPKDHVNGTSEMDIEEDSRVSGCISRNMCTSMPERNSSQLTQSKSRLSTSFVVGRAIQDLQHEDINTITRMEIDDILPKSPLIVVDGANVAYAYAKAMGLNEGNSSLRYLSGGVEPDVQGIQICASYFSTAGCRVQVVLPVHWMRKKPRAGDGGQNENARMITPQVDILRNLELNNILCCSPPADDDDAYVIAMARREDARARRKNLHYISSSVTNISSAGGAFVLSNDFFRDAIARDSSGELKCWLDGNHHHNNQSPLCPPGRISYSFCNLGSMNQYGDLQLDFMPNPRHILIEAIEKLNRTNELLQG